ncbi:MAG: hypothetical protein V1661_02190 [bacterium]
MAHIQKKVNDRCNEMDNEVRTLIAARKLDSAIKKALSKIKTEQSPVNLYSYALALASYGFLKNNAKKKILAKKYYKLIIKTFPKTLHAHLSDARICEETGEPGKALPFYKKAFKICPNDLNAIHIANIYIRLNQKKLALRYYLIAENFKKGSARSHIEKNFK